MTRVTFQEKYYPAVKETLYQATLKNGLTVSLLPKNDFNEVYGVVTVYVGSVDTEFTARDSKKKTYPKGIAHFLEHKLFERENSEDIMAAPNLVNEAMISSEFSLSKGLGSKK